MPTRPKRPCPRCRTNLTTSRLCPSCTTDRAREDIQRRGNANDRGYDVRHREWREAILKRDPVCKICKENPSTVADHVIPMRKGGKRFDMNNGQGLCGTCHNSVKQSAERKAS